MDLAQLVAGAFVMALPMALTGEVLDLGTTLSVPRTLSILLISIFTLGVFNWALFYGGHFKKHRYHFVKRCLSAYLETFAISFLLLWLIDQASRIAGNFLRGERC